MEQQGLKARDRFAFARCLPDFHKLNGITELDCEQATLL